MPTNLPLVPSIPNYRVGTTIENVQYVLDVRWNARDGAWFMDVSDSTAVPIALGIKLVLGIALGRRITDARFPTGLLYAADLSNQGLDATLDDLGTRVVIQYLTADELTALGI